MCIRDSREHRPAAAHIVKSRRQSPHGDGDAAGGGQVVELEVHGGADFLLPQQGLEVQRPLFAAHQHYRGRDGALKLGQVGGRCLQALSLIHLSYAYMTYRTGKVLSEVAAKRLSAIREYAEFGSGFKIAMRDLEIRGAGNLLGPEQSGFLMSVGYDLYLKLLEEAVLEEKGEAPAKRRECTADLSVAASIPDRYVPSPEQRMDLYLSLIHIFYQNPCQPNSAVKQFCHQVPSEGWLDGSAEG